jgi:hypothetical protein
MQPVMAVVRFDEAWRRATALIRDRLGAVGDRVVVVRDVLGRVRIAFDDRGEAIPAVEPELARLADELHATLGAYSPGRDSLVLRARKMFAPERVFESEDAMRLDPGGSLRTLDRSIIAADWTRLPVGESAVPRITFFGVKGGVGRSTAAAVLAWKLSQAGKRVLVLDLDLESPGLGSVLLPPDRHPDFGAVDWFVESAVGQADDALLIDMVGQSPIAAGTGEIAVVPAGGRRREEYHYLPKLARAYSEIVHQDRSRHFGERLADFVSAVEAKLRPDVTLLDSRSGLHDIAAVAVTRLGALGLLFAVDTAQTWDAYASLFQTWRDHQERARTFRENLRLVAAVVPETGTANYLDAFPEHAYPVFADYLYEEAPAGELGTFSFDVRDPSAPHVPLVVYWSRTFQQFDPVSGPDRLVGAQVDTAFGDLFRGVQAWLEAELPG